jgi:hypothetical protein
MQRAILSDKNKNSFLPIKISIYYSVLNIYQFKSQCQSRQQPTSCTLRTIVELGFYQFILTATAIIAATDQSTLLPPYTDTPLEIIEMR